MQQEDIQKLGAGWIHAPLARFYREGWEPMLNQVLESCPAMYNPKKYTLDVKVHMLMPGQWPCIPNWHCDNVPRDDEGNLLMAARDVRNIMYLWTSGRPDTFFRDGDEEWVAPKQEWMPFTQYDEHRGSMCEEHTWRLFMRVTPSKILPSRETKEDCIRRHSQVYLDSSNFTW